MLTWMLTGVSLLSVADLTPFFDVEELALVSSQVSRSMIHHCLVELPSLPLGISYLEGTRLLSFCDWPLILSGSEAWRVVSFWIALPDP